MLPASENPVNSEPCENADSFRLQAPCRNFRKVGSVIVLRAPQLYDVFSERGFASSAENASGKCGAVREFRCLPSGSDKSTLPKVCAVIPIRAPQLSSVFPKGDCYPLLKARQINAESYVNSHAYRLEVPNRHSRKVRSVILLGASLLSYVFPNIGFLLSSEKAADKCGTVRKSICLVTESAKATISDSGAAIFLRAQRI